MKTSADNIEGQDSVWIIKMEDAKQTTRNITRKLSATVRGILFENPTQKAILKHKGVF